MTIKSRINQRILNAMLVILVMLITAIYSITASAQSLATGNGNLLVNASRAIVYAENLNFTAKAVPLNSFINSAYEELKPAVSPDGKRVYFSRVLHPDNTQGPMDNEDIWYAEFDKQSRIWSQPIRMAGVLNNAGPNFINNVSVTGDTLILGNEYLKKGKMRAGLSYTVNINGQWSTPVAIEIENDYNMSSHSQSHVSLNSGVIIRAVERVESVGGRDLYVSFWDGEKASEPVNMGAVINTGLEEGSPHLAADNKTLYFASKGHQGHGGFDIYVTRRLDDSWTNWSVPENLGPAVNGAMDDQFFSITHCGKFAIFSRQISVHNVDIFRIPVGELYVIDPLSSFDVEESAEFPSLTTL